LQVGNAQVAAQCILLFRFFLISRKLCKSAVVTQVTLRIPSYGRACVLAYQLCAPLIIALSSLSVYCIHLYKIAYKTIWKNDIPVCTKKCLTVKSTNRIQ
jgi:hypothetical protein